MRSNRLRSLILFSALALLPVSPVSLEAREIIRLGTLAPDGSSWHTILRRMGADWGKETDGELRLRIYAGGAVGDEGEMIRKMRIGQLQAAAISNAGLAEIDPRAYAIMLPLMFESYQEWDFVRQKVNPILEEKLREKGFVVLAWSDVGWLYFFTKEPMMSPRDLQRMRLAGSATESTTIDIFKWAGFNPVPISAVDTMTGLQTGLIDSIYLPIILAEASQFYRQAPNMTDMKWAPLQGAVVMHEKGWARLTAEQKEDVLRITRQVGEELQKENRERELESLEAMKRRGLKIVEIDETAREEWRKAARQAYPQVRERLVPPEMFDEVQRLRDEFRKQEANQP